MAETTVASGVGVAVTANFVSCTHGLDAGARCSAVGNAYGAARDSRRANAGWGPNMVVAKPKRPHLEGRSAVCRPDVRKLQFGSLT
jgi:hypothetical protein